MAVARERQNMTLVQKSEGNSRLVGPKRGDYSEQINHKTKWSWNKKILWRKSQKYTNA